ncbi:MdtA/MuxA family multidrug efflux RND transporter periplasmic adaptor subunit [Corticimicrobacter populi]|uniref:Multidrug transporter subunit MdtA n=1 Tax=Corticimicrobacter populi TaxID=2175229 RepID=A0A2V1K384_9BURK|nr:MdtA/MuxA family multidrug efflux RND transporter periplasmic adaptor subunit [Corticimicrobacter populi]PWF25541.1 multidrug transporter subunit MdtA [Corticimicrobacter populi]
MASFSSSRTKILCAVAALLVAGGLYAWLSGPQEAAGPSRYAGPVAVSVVLAEQQDFPLVLHALGTVTPLNTVVVRSRVEGELVELPFKEGQAVEAGTLLARIDPRPYEVKLAQALGQQQQNQAQLRNAQADLKRYQTLFSQDSIARQQLESQEALVRQYSGTARSDQAAVDEARLQLGYTRIEAPISGRLGLRKVDIGNLVRAGDEGGLVTITQMQPISVLFSLPETQLQEVLPPLRRGEALRVEAWDRSENSLLATGTLRTIDNQIDTTTGTVRLRAEFDNTDEALFPNQFVNVRLQVRNIAGVIAVAEDAIQYGSRGTYVYIAGDDSKSYMRQVRLGPMSQGQIVVEDGLKPGERVILEGLDRLREGREVEIIGNAADPGEANLDPDAGSAASADALPGSQAAAQAGAAAPAP